MTLGRFPDRSWRRRPGRPRNRWLDQLRGDNNSSPADPWRRASSRGHSGGDATVLADYALTTTTTTTGTWGSTMKHANAYADCSKIHCAL